MKRTLWISTTAFCFVALNLLAAPLDSLDVWHWRNPVPQGNNLRGVASGNGRLVAVGDGGTVMVSTNGVDWETRIRAHPDGFPIFMNTLAFGNGVFVASRGYDGLSTSVDGVIWTRQHGAPDAEAVVFCGGQFLALQYTTVLTSTNGSDWTSTALPVDGKTLRGAACGNGTTVVVGDSGAIATTTNGVNWQSVPSGTNANLTAATFDGKEFLVTGWDGVLLVSSNGLSWTNRGFPERYYFLSAVSHQGRTVLAGQTFAVVENGTNTTWHAPFDTILVNAITVDGNGVYWAVGEGGAIRRSPDGYNWTEVTSRVPELPTLGPLSGVAFDGTRFVAGGWNYLLLSSNGVNWTKTDAPPFVFVSDVAWGNGRFVLAGFDYSHPLTQPFASSADGINWAVHSLPLGSFEQFARVKFLNGHFIAVGNRGAIALSTNGMDWTVQSVGSDFWLTAVAYGEGKYLVGAQDGVLFASGDAKTWTSNRVANVEGYWDMTYGRGRFVAAYIRSLWPEGLMWSHNGREWTSVPGFAERIIYQNGVFVAAGASSILTSFDGREFTLRNNVFNQVPNGLVFGGRTFVVVGTAAGILQSDPVPPVFMLSAVRDAPELGPLLRLDSPLDGSYQIESSADSILWTAFTTVQSTNGVFEIRDNRPTQPGTRLYRARLLDGP